MGGGMDRQTNRQTENSRTLFDKDCSLGSVKSSLTTSRC